jgi:DNA-binding NtrC family response regulator
VRAILLSNICHRPRTRGGGRIGREQLLSKRILAVDDDENYLEGIGELLERAGYEVVLASTLASAKRAVESARPDLVLVDIRLGELNGLQLVSMISTTRPRVPAIIVSGFDDPVLRADAAASGATFLLKPIVPRQLLRLIEDRLGLNAVEGRL